MQSENIELVRWCLSVGLSEEQASELINHIDIARCRSAGALWRYAGLGNPQIDRTVFNARLKLLCLEIGERLTKAQGSFGVVYSERVYAEFRSGKNRRTFDHLHAQARRYTIKRFLAAYHETAWWLRFRQLPPSPYHHEIPNAHLISGLREARCAA